MKELGSCAGPISGEHLISELLILGFDGVMVKSWFLEVCQGPTNVLK